MLDYKESWAPVARETFESPTAGRGKLARILDHLTEHLAVAFGDCRHSAFFGTPLQSLLAEPEIRRLVLTGTMSHQCVLFTAMDAHVREYELIVPADCVGATSRAETPHALFVAERALGARTPMSARVRF